MKKLILILSLTLFFTACGGLGFTVKYDGQQIPFEAKSSWITSQGANFGGKFEGEKDKHALRWLALRNFDYEVKSPYDTEGNPTADGQVKLFFSLHEDSGTNPQTPIKVSTFSGGNDGPMSLEFVNVHIFRNGKVESFPVSLSGQGNRKDSEVKITSVSDDTVTGEVNINVKAKDKDLIVKGTFTAKIFKVK
ncbi:MAG: hypothetical protein K1X72_27105 [Pyrinomonadaceae bacterium]|nr:hypothetical protein [Pyrinomonadaceae bacterium]